MKRFGNLYEKIYNIENIRLAHQNARKGKKHYDEVKDGNSTTNKNRLWVVTIQKPSLETTMRCDSTNQALKFIKENICLVKR
jgi:hypothetical protein